MFIIVYASGFLFKRYMNIFAKLSAPKKLENFTKQDSIYAKMGISKKLMYFFVEHTFRYKTAKNLL